MSADAVDGGEPPEPIDLDDLARIAAEVPPGRALVALDAARQELVARRDQAGLERVVELAELAKDRAGVATDDGLLGIRVLLNAEWDLRRLRRPASDPLPQSVAAPAEVALPTPPPPPI